MRTPTFIRTSPPASQVTKTAPPEKPPQPLPLCFLLSHLEEEAVVRLDGTKVGVCEVQGLELDEPKLGAFAGFLNALDFPVQLLVRQHPPDLGRMREALREDAPEGLPERTRAAADSLHGLLQTLERREGILDRRFYAACEEERADELHSLLTRAGLSVHPLKGRTLRRLLLAATLGGTPADRDEETPVELQVNRRDLRLGDHLARSLHLGRWPRSLAHRLRPLRPPRRGALHRQRGAARAPRSLKAAPVRARLLRQPQRPRRARGRNPLAPARGEGRDAPRGALRGEGAPAQREDRRGGRLRGRDHRRQPRPDPLLRRPPAPPPPLLGEDAHGQVHAHGAHRHPQAAREGGGPRR